MKLTQDALAQVQTYCDDTITYVNELTTEWRKLTLEATRRATELLRAKA
ncbi:MAG TPA: hypothetical protein VL172_15050 [Kofleriaceae bacterium]|nr:hypothetical protein [Kofleriaceae bacterium]